MTRIAAILPAAGLGTRMGSEVPKQFLEIDGTPIVLLTLRRLAECQAISEFFVSTRSEETGPLEQRLAREKFNGTVHVVKGGETRQQSVANALARIGAETDLVAVHDAVRPFVTREQVQRVIAEASARGAAILGVPAIDTVKEVRRSSLPQDVALISSTIPREKIVLAQTPQVFETKLLKDAFARAEREGMTASDEAALVEWIGHDVYVVQGSERNIKITRPADMELARFYLEQERHGK
jgi:2-C-methyl-D-erythritol 4-phosphate cytidylyltransferase